jgi:serine/threonine protein kinase
MMSAMGTTGGDVEGRLIAGRYRLLGRLGRGGMGTVWRADDELLNRQVAVKEVHLRAGWSAGEREQQRLRTLREARAVAKVRHPSVVVIHDVVEQDGEPWIVMELVDGTSLGERISADGPLPPREVARIGLAVLAALRAAHARGVLHRDVKPDNVLLERETDRVVLTDFGIARLDGSATLTEDGAFLGSPEFTAPERARGGTVGPESDLWSLGVLLCAALEGRSPFRREEMSSVLYAVLFEEISIPASAEPLGGVVRGLLQREAESRLTLAEAEQLLQAFLESGSTATTGARALASAATTSMTAAAAGRAARQRPDLAKPAPPPVGPPVSRSSRRFTGRRAALLLAAAAVVCAAAAGAFLALSRSGDAVAGAGTCSSATSSPAPTQRATSTPSASPSASPSSSPSASASPTSTAVVPAGYSLHREASGFSLAVPSGWQRSTDSAGRIFYLSPDQAFRIGVHLTAPSANGVLADLTAQAAAGPRTNPGYRNGSVQATVFHGTTDAALWQWTWNGYTGDGFGARLVQDLCWTENARSYDFWVSAPLGRVNEADHYFQIVSSTFRAS